MNWSPKFLCSSMRSPIVLSDGRVTTCTADCDGDNVFANIYEHDFGEVLGRYAALRPAAMEEPGRLPHCLACYSKLPQSKKIGLPRAEWMVQQNDEAQRQKFIRAFDPNAVAMNFELSSKCNLRCAGCSVTKPDFGAKRGTTNIDMDRLIEWVSGGGRRIRQARLYHMGETWAHPRWADFTHALKAQNSASYVFTSTNGMLMLKRGVFGQLPTAGFSHIMFSVHGARQASAERYMGKAFRIEVALEAARRVAEIRDRWQLPLRLSWRYVLFEWNDSDEEIKDAQEQAEMAGFDEIHFTLNCYPSPAERFNVNSPAWHSLREACALAWPWGRQYQDATPMVALHPTARGKRLGGET